MELKFRTLHADEIEVRVGNTIKDREDKNKISGFTLLLYKTARVDAIILDETVGAFNWQKRYYQVKNTMVCSIGIYDKEKNEWIWKDDGGDDDSQMEKVKSELSDSQKRAAFVWGIGRELYFGPKITIWTSSGNSERDYYSVKSVSFDQNKVMTEITIVNEKTGKVAYSYKNGNIVSQNGEKGDKTTNNELNKDPYTIRESDKTWIKELLEKFTADECTKFYQWLEKKYNTMSYEALSEEQGVRVVNIWKVNKR